MAERYGSTDISSGKDISEIKSTLNDLATRLKRKQLGAVTPERKTVQFHTKEEHTKSYSRDTSPVTPIRNFDSITGQRFKPVAVYDVTTGARIGDIVTTDQRPNNDTQLQVRNRSPSPSYQYNDRGYNSQR